MVGVSIYQIKNNEKEKVLYKKSVLLIIFSDKYLFSSYLLFILDLSIL